MACCTPKRMILRVPGNKKRREFDEKESRILVRIARMAVALPST